MSSSWLLSFLLSVVLCCGVVWCDVVLRCVACWCMVCCAVLWVVVCCVLLWCCRLCCAMLCYAMLWFAMLFYGGLLCYLVFYCVIFLNVAHVMLESFLSKQTRFIKPGSSKVPFWGMDSKTGFWDSCTQHDNAKSHNTLCVLSKLQLFGMDCETGFWDSTTQHHHAKSHTTTQHLSQRITQFNTKHNTNYITKPRSDRI